MTGAVPVQAAQRWLAVATLVTRNLVPIAGVIFLDWKAVNIIVLYFADFMLDLATCLLMLALLDPEARAEAAKLGTAGAWIKAIIGVLIAGIVLLAVFAFVFGMPVYFALAMDEGSLEKLFTDERFLKGLLLHLLLSAFNFVLAYRYLSRMRRDDPKFVLDAAVRRRFNYVTGRWFAVYATGLFAAFFPILMVVAYSAATVYAELSPRRIEEMLNLPK